MSNQKREIESRGQDVDAAIAAGLQQLGVKMSDVIVDVIDEGNRGLLGIGSRPAVVRLMVLSAPAAPPAKAEPKPQPRQQPRREPKPAPKPRRSEAPRTPKPARSPKPAKKAENGEEWAEEAHSSETILETSVEIVRELLEKMEVSAQVSGRLSEPDDLTGRQIPIVDVNGEDLGALIGSRGETLNAIQHISRLMVGHKLKQRITFVVDIEGYRARREQALTRLAERMASKVSARNRAISLEPMPPHERRIIHMALRDDKEVYTQSTGEGSRRKVRILPKE